MSHSSSYSVVQESVHVDTVLADADEIEVRGFTSGMVYVPTGSTITTITWYAATEPGGTFLAVEDGAATPAAVVTKVSAAAKCAPIPSACMGAGSLKAVGNADGTIDVSLKG